MIRKAAISLIKFYQMLISPFLGKNCRFYPSCSAYSVQCFETLPLHQALYFTLKRLLRCHPFSSGGHDPVPNTHHTSCGENK